MPVAVSLSGLQLILLGLAMLVVAFVLRRTAIRGRRSPERQKRSDQRAWHSPETSTLERLEVRLYDYQRQVEGRIQTSLTLLERLIHEADEQCRRLEQLLQLAQRTSQGEGESGGRVPASSGMQQQGVGQQAEAGPSSEHRTGHREGGEREIQDDAPKPPSPPKADAA